VQKNVIDRGHFVKATLMAGDGLVRGVDRHNTYRGFPTPRASGSPSAGETTRKTANGTQTQHGRVSKVSHTYDRRSVGPPALSRRVRAARGHRARGSCYAQQGDRRCKGGPGRGDSDVHQRRGRV